MQITGSYNNYLNITSLLSPMGIRQSGDLVMQVFSEAIGNLQNKIDNQIFSEQSADALKQLYGQVSDLAAKAVKLNPNDISSVFNDRTATSSDIDVLTATAFDAFSQNTGATRATYNISVTQLAQAQENIGLELNKADSSAVDLGVNTFNINMNGHDHELGIVVEDSDTNEDVLQKMATAIYEAAIGVSAEVTSDNEDGTQQLVIKADDTGMSNSFTISDASGNAVEGAGVGSVSAEAQDALYTVDGTDNTSVSNSIYLDDGMVKVNLEGVGESSLQVAPAGNEVKDAISSLISEVNSFVDFLGNNKDYIKEEVLSSVNSFINDHKRELESLGITQIEDGRLEIDNEKLALAVSKNNSDIEDAFGGFDGFGVQLNNYASRISMDSPLNYSKETENMNIDSVDYIFNTSAGMLRQITQGILLNTYL